MSGLINKVKEALHSDKSHTEQPEGTHGHHNTRAANAADPRIDSDRDHRAAPGTHTGTHTGTTGTSGLHSTTGAHTGTTGTSGLHSTGAHTGTTGAYSGSTNAGPHDSNLLNKADPRVDSDRDHSRNLGANPSGTATTGTHTGTSGLHSTGAHTGTSGLHSTTGAHTGTSGLHSSTGAHTGTHTGTTGLHSDNRGLDGPASKTDGPHNSNILNKVDPRIDSDRDHSRNLGANPSGTATTGNNTTGTSGLHSTGAHTGTSGLHSTTGAHTGTHTGTSGLHSTTGAHTGTHTGTTGGIGSSTYGAPEGSHGPHSSRAANAADPRVDSDRDHRGATGTAGGSAGIGGFGTSSNTHGTHGATTGTHGTHGTSGLTGSHAPGPAPNTAGPHKSDMLNKVDPRVDSDLDGSKTVGNNSMMHKDPTDAAQVPPSVLQKHIGAPVVEHDDHQHDRAKRHSISHQEEHRGL